MTLDIKLIYLHELLHMKQYVVKNHFLKYIVSLKCMIYKDKYSIYCISTTYKNY